MLKLISKLMPNFFKHLYNSNEHLFFTNECNKNIIRNVENPMSFGASFMSFEMAILHQVAFAVISLHPQQTTSFMV